MLLSKRKGSRVELLVKREFQKAGFETVRSAGSFGKADLYVKDLGSVQVKARKRFSIYSLFDGADILVVKADRKEPIVVMPLGHFLRIVGSKKG